MDWYQLYQDMFQTYIKSQENMWQSWETAMQDAQATQSRISWEQSVKMWENSTLSLITTQKRWVAPWAKSIASSVQDKTLAATYEKNLLEMADVWEQTQQVLWKNWFAMLKEAYPKTEQPSPSDAFSESLNSWNEQLQKTMQMQMDWANNWAKTSQEVASNS